MFHIGGILTGFPMEPGMGADTRMVLIDLDSKSSNFHIHLLLNAGVGHAVIHTINFDMIVE
jgi:hypothetical protein